MNNLNAVKNEEGRPDLDDLLRDFFHVQMPQPWPTFQAPKTTQTRQPVSQVSRYSGRLALAACIALLLAGYLTLSGFFPQHQASTGVNKITDTALKEKSSQRTPPANQTPPGAAEDRGNELPPLVPMHIISPSKKLR